MFKIPLFLFLFFNFLYAFEFKVATYNVENLFDLHYDGNEYKEYIPYTQAKWNKKNYTIKLNNTVKVINNLDADIIALQEIESQKVFNALQKKLPHYTYSSFVKNQNSNIGLGVLSRYPIKMSEKIFVKNSRVNRPIQKVIVSIKNHELTLYNNHWPSKRQAENERVRYAFALKKAIDTLGSHEDYILLGDFNSNYNEYETIKLDKKLNTTRGLTGINHVLNSYENDKFITPLTIQEYRKKVHYNPWLELSYEIRFSSKYRGQNTTPDSILLSSALFDNYAVSYKKKSFQQFKPSYLYNNRKIKRWTMKNQYTQHVGEGYSDHLPIFATFTTKKSKQLVSLKVAKYSISQLYETINDLPVTLKNVIVIFKNKNSAILKQENGRAIYAYNCAQELKLGHIYNLKITKIKEHYGLKEILAFETIDTYNKKVNHKELFVNATKIDLHNSQFQNEIITNLTGEYKNGYLYTPTQKIKLYAKNKKLLPNNGENITIISGHLGFFKNKAQIIIYKQQDIKVNP